MLKKTIRLGLIELLIGQLTACARVEDGCRISNEICAIARRQPSRRDLGQTCAGSQEQCVDLRERCLRCR